jgi:membrane-bound lytic murein transglycosylase D
MFNINVWHESFEWEAVRLPRQVSLDIVAEEAGIERDLLRRLNAQLLHGISPAVSGYQLIVPKADIEKINLVLEREDLKLIRYHYHVVRQGDTLWSMSGHYGASLNVIEQHNPGISSRYLRIGETVVIPAFNDVAPPPSRTVVSTQAFNGIHLVKSGETLWSLSRSYGVDLQDLAEANNMTINQILREGRTLKVPIIIEQEKNA